MHIVIIEDNQDHLELICDILHDAYDGCAKIIDFSNLQDGLAYLGNHNADLLLCDLKLPDSTIAQTVEHLKALEDAPAIIVLTSLHDESLAQQLLKQGIQDYVPKDEITESHLTRACQYAIERRKLNRALINKNEDYKAFCYSLTHDFRGSLWQISQFAERFKKEAEQASRDNQPLPLEHIDKIFEKVDSIRNLVDDLQSYLSLEVVQSAFTEFNLKIPVDRAIDNLGELIDQHHAEIRCAPLPTIMGNVAQIQLLFYNLISNAIKYNDKTNPSVHISYKADDPHHHVITIQDNGTGIDHRDFDKIFIPFERCHRRDFRPGSGLGLSIVKKIVQHHLGRISVDSVVGEGTRFTISLAKTDFPRS